MITTLLLNVLFFFLNFVFGLLSSVLNFVGLNTGLQNFFASVYQYNGFFPVDTAYRFIGYAVDFWLVVFTFEFFMWVIHLVRGN